MNILSQEIASYLDADPPAREVSIQRLADGRYEVTLTDLARDIDAETPRGCGATIDEAMACSVDLHDDEERLADERRAALGRISDAN